MTPSMRAVSWLTVNGSLSYQMTPNWHFDYSAAFDFTLSKEKAPEAVAKAPAEQDPLDLAREKVQAGEYEASVELDPARLEDVRRRRDLLFRLTKKYGGSLADVIRAGAEARRCRPAVPQAASGSWNSRTSVASSRACSLRDSAAAADCSTSAAFCCVMRSRSDTAVLTWPMPDDCSAVAWVISVMISLTR